MLAHTKKHPTESIRLVGSPDVISRLRKYALEVGAGIIEAADSIPASDISPELDTNPGGVYQRHGTWQTAHWQGDCKEARNCLALRLSPVSLIVSSHKMGERGGRRH